MNELRQEETRVKFEFAVTMATSVVYTIYNSIKLLAPLNWLNGVMPECENALSHCI